MHTIEVEHLTKDYGSGRGVFDVSIAVDKGEVFGFLGPNGAGKSTTIRHLMGFSKPQSGSTKIEGMETFSHYSQVLNRVGYIPGEIALPAGLTGWEFIRMMQDLQKIHNEERLEAMRNLFELDDEALRGDTKRMSLGVKRKLAVVAAFMSDPDVLILDEPTSMLDPLAAANLLGMVRRINRELGVAVLICEHRLEEVFQTADQILLMKRGKILWKDTPERIAEHLQQDPDSSRIYYGLPGAVRIFGELRKQGIYPEGKKLPLNIRDARNALAELRTDGQYVIRTLEKEKKDNTEQNVIEAKELWFRYEKNAPDILRSMDFQLKKGEIFTLLGGNGAGKSTFLKLAAGLLRPQRGKVKTSEGMRLAMLPQSPQALFHYDTVWEEFLESAVAGWKEEAARQKAEEMAAFLELDGKKFSHPYDLSGGEMQRAAVGKLLLQRADILLMDEPTKGLDAYLKQSLAEMLRKLADQKLSILMVTHDLEFAASYADRCGLLFDGQLISEDEPHGFFSGNRFYTTAAGLIARDRIEKVITCGEVIAACQNAE